jgi:hypothetical protein
VAVPAEDQTGENFGIKCMLPFKFRLYDLDWWLEHPPIDNSR